MNKCKCRQIIKSVCLASEIIRPDSFTEWNMNSLCDQCAENQFDDLIRKNLKGVYSPEDIEFRIHLRRYFSSQISDEEILKYAKKYPGTN